MPGYNIRISKFLSLVLRHKPETIGLILDEGGWASVSELLRACEQYGFPITWQELQTVVALNDKKRFSFNDDSTLIRANQGHSVKVELGYEPQEPPELLYHGTTERFLPSILSKGLLKGQRHHVHLSPDVATATKVGARRGKPIILQVKSGQMHRDGYIFYLSVNGVWLTDQVPVNYINKPQS